MNKTTGYVYTTDAGVEVTVSKSMHEAIQLGHIFNSRQGKGALHANCEWRTTNSGEAGMCVRWANKREAARAAKPVQFPKAENAPKAPRKSNAAPRAQKADGTLTKSQQVRNAIVKLNGHGVEYVINWAMEQLGMPKAQAATYVKGNWDKALAAA